MTTAYDEYLKSLAKDAELKKSLAVILEAEKERNFQSVFKSLWPNLHEKLNPPENYSKEIAELEKKKELFNAIIQKDIDIYKALAPKQPDPPKPMPVFLPPPPPPPQPLSTQDTINITIGGLNTGNPKIDIKNMRPATAAVQPHSHLSNWNFHSHKINTMSSYDFPDTNRTQLWNSTDDKLLKSIQESQERLKYAQKLEKTTDIVDDIVGKVRVLQSEMKKKSTALEIQSEIDRMRKSRENLYGFLDDHEHIHQAHHHHHHHDHDLTAHHRSRSIEKKDFNNLHHLHHHDCHDHHHHRSSSAHRLSRISSPISILKSTEFVTHPVRKRSVSFHRSSSSDLCHTHRPKSIERIKSYKYVAPKVNSWNFSKNKLDQNIY